MRCSKTTISKGGGGWEGVQAMNLFGGGGSSLNFSEGDQTLPTTSLDPRTFHMYIFYKSNKVIIIEN